MSESDYSDEERQFRAGSTPNKPDGKNKLKLGEFHRNNISKKSRKPSLKKQLRDRMRLMERQGLPEEVKNAQASKAKELKDQLKKQKEAVRFETRYNKVKFIEKRKVVRKMEQLQRQIKAGLEVETAQKLLAQQQDFLTYINHYPPLWKYIALFPAEDSEEAKKQRTENMSKVLQMASVKQAIRDKDLERDLHED